MWTRITPNTDTLHKVKGVTIKQSIIRTICTDYLLENIFIKRTAKVNPIFYALFSYFQYKYNYYTDRFNQVGVNVSLYFAAVSENYVKKLKQKRIFHQNKLI